ncbi:hypothetical protein [Mucilaginibacter segetis]|uniref:Beta/gamma crystallin n=1 Tax=Mucilaginibacter segetis TaxID=2793071 RepID=A0A934UNC0_9SPHI|nr:hypothetical protein [Mucilaginibacter segetis]MBK0379915.1 hypothetical protein [Mucilaginibacter segetis]
MKKFILSIALVMIITPFFPSKAEDGNKESKVTKSEISNFIVYFILNGHDYEATCDNAGGTSGFVTALKEDNIPVTLKNHIPNTCTWGSDYGPTNDGVGVTIIFYDGNNNSQSYSGLVSY